MSRDNCINQNMGPKLFIHAAEKNKCTNQQIYVWNLTIDIIEKQNTIYNQLLEDKNELESKLSKILFDLKNYKINTARLIHNQTKVHHALRNEIKNFRPVMKQYEEVNQVYENQKEIQTQYSIQLNKLDKINQELLRHICHDELKGTDITHFSNNQDLRELLSEFLESKNPLVNVLETLPLNYPLRYIIFDGIVIGVSRFVMMDPDKNIVHFIENEELLSFDASKIEGIGW